MMLDETSVTSEEHSMHEPEPVVEETVVVRCDGVTHLRDPGEKGSPIEHQTVSALEKELHELKPFYYDKNREKYRPGEFFEVETEAAHGVVLRNGRQIGDPKGKNYVQHLMHQVKRSPLNEQICVSGGQAK